MKRVLSVFAALTILLAATACHSKPKLVKKGKWSEAIFAGGCFWCMETAFEGLPGVKSVQSGYIGGTKKDPSYREVSSGQTGHTEAVRVIYDPARISYTKLLQLFWHNIDPLTANAQFCDRGSQYRAGIFYVDEAQKRAALQSKLALAKRFKKPIVTEITKASTFYPAEEYHQDFFKKKPLHYKRYRAGCGRDRRLKQLWGKGRAATELSNGSTTAIDLAILPRTSGGAG